MVTSKEAVEIGINKGLSNEPSIIQIDEKVFQILMNLVYRFVPQDRIDELELMITERNAKMQLIN